jgi:hypothetical protein
MVTKYLVFAALAASMGSALGQPISLKTAAKPAVSCSPLPIVNPHVGFTANFNNPCYALTMTSSGGTIIGGEPNVVYSQAYYQVAPGYDLVVLGTFPNARFMSATLYDEHATPVGEILDYQMPPLGGSMINPFLPGAEYQPDQMYGFTVTFGGNLTSSPSPGCSASGSAINETVLNATEIHSGLTWTGYPDLPPGFPPHQTGANSGGTVNIRKYVGISTEAAPVVIVRQLSNGCALPVAQAIQDNIISTTQVLGTTTWLNLPQIEAHNDFAADIEPSECYPFDPTNQANWVRSADWYLWTNTAAAYMNATLAASSLQSVLSGQAYLRAQFPLPSTPPTPCASGQCSRTGNEQLRYFSFEFTQGGGSTITALDDQQLVTDQNGNVTIIAGVGPPPPQVTPANYYTYLDLSQFAGYSGFSKLSLRNLLPNASFGCSTFNVPNFTMEYNPDGGFMGAYVPTVDFPTASQIPAVPVPPIRPNSCAAAPPPPASCTLPH